MIHRTLPLLQVYPTLHHFDYIQFVYSVFVSFLTVTKPVINVIKTAMGVTEDDIHSHVSIRQAHTKL